VKYLLGERAEADLAEIWRYTAQQWTVAQADKYYRMIVAALETLAANPEIGRQRDDVRSGYRRYDAGAHVVFYRVVRNDIEIVRVLHQNMDVERHL
jgi:toxin ParE1/3/4